MSDQAPDDTRPIVFVEPPVTPERKRAIRAQYPTHRIVDRKHGPRTEHGLQEGDCIYTPPADEAPAEPAVEPAADTGKGATNADLDAVKSHADVDAIAEAEGVSLEGITKMADKVEAVREARKNG